MAQESVGLVLVRYFFVFGGGEGSDEEKQERREENVINGSPHVVYIK